MRYLVLHLSPHEHILEIHLERPADANHIDYHSIRIRFNMVFVTGVAVFGLPETAAEHPGSQAWHSLPVA
jgi:hypothetical protein